MYYAFIIHVCINGIVPVIRSGGTDDNIWYVWGFHPAHSWNL